VVGTWINIGTVLLGGGIGLLLGSRLSERLRETVMQGIGVITLVIGLQMALSTENVLIVLGSILLGGILGTAWHLDDQLNRFGRWVEQKVTGLGRQDHRLQETSRFAQGFITTSLLFCIGPMTFLGAIQDGLTGDFQLLAVKSVLDGFSAIAFAASLGPGVLLSAVTVFIIQGSLTLLSSFLDAFMTDDLIAEMTAVGGAMVLMIGFNLLRLLTIRVADFLPALFVVPVLVWLSNVLAP